MKPLDIQQLLFAKGDLFFVLVNPKFEAPTAQMRAVLPQVVPMAAAINNCAMGASLVSTHAFCILPFAFCHLSFAFFAQINLPCPDAIATYLLPVTHEQLCHRRILGKTLHSATCLLLMPLLASLCQGLLPPICPKAPLPDIIALGVSVRSTAELFQAHWLSPTIQGARGAIVMSTHQLDLLSVEDVSLTNFQCNA